MKRLKFLGPVAALAAAFTSDQVLAKNQESQPPSMIDKEHFSPGNVVENITMSNGEDAFNFVLKRVEGGQLMAAHSSHSSHGSHGSHRSHSSGY